MTRHRCDCGHESRGYVQAWLAHRKMDRRWYAYELVLAKRLKGVCSDPTMAADHIAYSVRAYGFDRGLDEALRDRGCIGDHEAMRRIVDDVRMPSRTVNDYV